MDTIDFNEFSTVGVLGTDTFERWRQKTNGIIEKVGTIDSTYPSNDEVLLLNNSVQSVGSGKTFSAGLTIGGNGGTVPLTTNSSSELLLSNNIVIGNDKGVSANFLESRNRSITFGSRTYTWPSSSFDEGYVFHNSVGQISFKTISQLTAEVSGNIAAATNVSTQPITPVGTVIGVKLSSPTPPLILDSIWLLCDGRQIPTMATAYPSLYAALGNIQFLPLLSNKVLIGATAPSGSIGATGASGPSYYAVYYYIKAVPDNVASFSLNSGNGITLSGQGGSPSINIYGGEISLNTSPEFTFVNKKLTLVDGSINHTKIQNADIAAATGFVGIPLRDINGYVRGNTPSDGDDETILVNKGYINGLGLTASNKYHKIKSLNGKGFNSYGVQPQNACVFVSNDNEVKVYGLTNATRGRRYGNYEESDACGHSLPLYGKTVDTVYSDSFNTYIKYDDYKVYAYGLNSNRKSGTVEASVNTQYLNGPKIAFGGEDIDEVILSYDAGAETTYARTLDGRLWVAGSNAYGQLGLGSSPSTVNSTSSTFIPRASLVRGLAITKAWLIGGGNTQTGYALASDGTLWACGYGTHGQMGRGNARATNTEWVPILNPETVNYSGGTHSRTAGTNVYTSTSDHGLQAYDVIAAGTNFHVVKVLTPNTFELHTSDSLNTHVTSPVSFSSSTQVHKRMSGIVNASFGGTGGNTFGYLQTTDGTLYSWGYPGSLLNPTGHLGTGSTTTINNKLPTKVNSTTGPANKCQAIYTGLDYTVHYVSVSGRLFACGNNNLGQLGIGKNGGFENEFIQITVPNLVDTGLPITANSYTVDKFFSPGTDCRFCIFQSGTSKKFTAWGSNSYNKLGGDNSSTVYTRPQVVFVDNDANVTDVQTTAILGGNTDLTSIMIQDQGQSYGNAYTCGFHHYNINTVPYRTVVPYFTKITNI